MLICPTVCVTVKQTLTVHLVCSTATPTTQQQQQQRPLADIEKWIEKFALISCACIAYSTKGTRNYIVIWVIYLIYICIISAIYLSYICISIFLPITHATQLLVGHSHLTHTSLAIRKCLATATSTGKARERGKGASGLCEEGESEWGSTFIAIMTRKSHTKSA